jgi:hypothetical protein
MNLAQQILVTMVLFFAACRDAFEAKVRAATAVGIAGMFGMLVLVIIALVLVSRDKGRK